MPPHFETPEESWEWPQRSMSTEVWNQENRMPQTRSAPFWEEQHYFRSNVSAPLSFTSSPHQPHLNGNYSRLNRIQSANRNGYSTSCDFDSSNTSSSSDSHGLPETSTMDLNVFFRSSVMSASQAFYCSSCRVSVRDCRCSASSSSLQCPCGCCSHNQLACTHTFPSEAVPRYESRVSNIASQNEFSNVAVAGRQEHFQRGSIDSELFHHSFNNQ